MKANFDAANSEVSRLSGVGVVIRDSNGDVLASCAEKIDQSYKVEDTEAMAALKALTFTHELGGCSIAYVPFLHLDVTHLR